MYKRDNAIQFESSEMFEDGCTVSFENSKLVISVAEEQAVDSYNQMFTCSAHLTNNNAVQLRDWLNGLGLKWIDEPEDTADEDDPA